MNVNISTINKEYIPSQVSDFTFTYSAEIKKSKKPHEKVASLPIGLCWVGSPFCAYQAGL